MRALGAGSSVIQQRNTLKDIIMYASQQYAHVSYAVSDQRAVSRQAAERYSQVSAVVEARRQRVTARREARARQTSPSVAVA